MLWHLSSLRPLTCSWPFLRPIKTLITLLSQLVSSSQLTPTPRLRSFNCKIILTFYHLTTISSYHVIDPYGISSDCPHPFGQMAESFLDNCSETCPTESQKCLRNIVCGLRFYLCQDNPLLAEPDRSSNLFQVSSPHWQLYTGTRSEDIRAFAHMHK